MVLVKKDLAVDVAKAAPRSSGEQGIASLVAMSVAAAVTGLALLTAGPASGSVSGMCDRAARMAAQRTGVPLEVLLAITRTETGRAVHGRLSPWPWTVNMEGAGKWFASRGEALDYVSRHQDRGARSFDIGCFQVNHRWHGHKFASVEQMFDPEANALYAAEFLRDLHGEMGGWSGAAGAYHSRTPKHAARYRARFDDILAALGAGPLHPGPDRNDSGQAASPRAIGTNPYPFLKAASVEARFGSLVPLGGAGGAVAPFVAGMGSSQ